MSCAPWFIPVRYKIYFQSVAYLLRNKVGQKLDLELTPKKICFTQFNILYIEVEVPKIRGLALNPAAYLNPSIINHKLLVPSNPFCMSTVQTVYPSILHTVKNGAILLFEIVKLLYSVWYMHYTGQKNLVYFSFLFILA